MKKTLIAAAVMGFAISTPIAMAADTPATATATTAATTTSTLSSDMDKLSYSIGADLGRNFKKQDIQISPAAMVQGLQDSINGKALQLTDDQMKEALTKFQKELIAKRAAEMNKKGEEWQANL